MNILSLSPHTDDSELGAGASLSRWRREGEEITIVAFSTGSKITGSSETEQALAADVLSVPYEYHCYPDGHLLEYRQHICDFMYQDLNARLQPDLVLVPSRGNVHQDHQVITAEALRVFRNCSILGYELPWGDVLPFHPQLYVRVTMADVELKMLALEKYASQVAQRLYFQPRIVRAQLNMRGVQVKAEYAEAFEVIRWVV